jgi:hypothetical protein
MELIMEIMLSSNKIYNFEQHLEPTNAYSIAQSSDKLISLRKESGSSSICTLIRRFFSAIGSWISTVLCCCKSPDKTEQKPEDRSDQQLLERATARFVNKVKCDNDELWENVQRNLISKGIQHPTEAEIEQAMKDSYCRND